jgi:acyl dehydratase
VGDATSFDKTWTKEDVTLFSKLSEDTNPLHTDEGYAQTTRFGQPLVHGMLVASSLSTLAGMYLPGKYSLILKQTLLFKNPVFIGDTVTIQGRVTAKVEVSNIISLDVEITKGEQVVVSGEMFVQVLQ